MITPRGRLTQYLKWSFPRGNTVDELADVTDQPRIREASNWSSREFRLSILFAVILVYITAWFPAPVERSSVPGQLMDFHATDGRSLDVAALTVRWNTTNKETVQNYWRLHLPSGLSGAQSTSRLGEGQGQARRKAQLAVEALTGMALPSPVVYGGGKVKGTSSGLGWALSTLAQHDPLLVKGLRIAATGEISSTGFISKVGAVGSKLRSPVIGQFDLVFVPYDQFSEAYFTLKDRRVSPYPLVLGVRTLGEAVGVLCLINSGSPTCSTLLDRDQVDAHIEVAREESRETQSGHVVFLGPNNLPACVNFNTMSELRGFEARCRGIEQLEAEKTMTLGSR